LFVVDKQHAFASVDALNLQAKANNVVDLEMLKQAEDEVRGILDKWPKWKQAIGYRYLYNLEIRISDVDRIIREGLEKQHDR
jgi:hypothetical protein